MLDFKHIYNVLATSILETFAPTRCVGCDFPGELLCANCASELPFIDLTHACPRCGAPYGRRLCTECPNPGSDDEKALLEQRAAWGMCSNAHAGIFPFSEARCALSFEGVAKSLIRIYKDGDELRLEDTIASLMCQTMRGGEVLPDWTCWADLLVYVPASSDALRRRGFDHMERIACACSEQTGLAVSHAFENLKGVHDQRELGRTQRMLNRLGSFAATFDSEEPPAHVILVDDVFTTGATLSAATHALLDAGAREVRVVTLARVW